ncbi:MAG TPA: phosphoribosylglycinamide formyltransferase [Chitinophagales bacterium]|nr:phosphoribosylglycinamide formyltransferase [Chitinophagales bacterium]
MKNKINIAIFISGAGTNARRIIEHFKNHSLISISLIVSNSIHSGALQISKDSGIPFFFGGREEFYKSNRIIEALQAHKVQAIVLAGFLWLIPESLLKLYPNRIINIHPSLLPKYGGKGMYGMKVHEAVKNANETKTGITIHVVNSEYDKGEVLLQESIDIHFEDHPEMIAQKIHQLEYQFFPPTIEKYFVKEFNL